MTAAPLPAWLDAPAAANDPTWHLGEQLQTDRVDLRKGNALVQSPDFVVDFILDLTLNPAVEEFGLASTKLIDPSCGTRDAGVIGNPDLCPLCGAAWTEHDQAACDAKMAAWRPTGLHREGGPR